YWAALNRARHGAWRSRTEETTTAADCTATAGPRPQTSSSANVNAIEEKTVASGSRPGAMNGRMSTMTASAAITQNEAGRPFRRSGRWLIDRATPAVAAATTAATYPKNPTARSPGIALRVWLPRDLGRRRTALRGEAASMTPPDTGAMRKARE